MCDIFFKTRVIFDSDAIEILEFDIRNLFIIVLILHEYISNYIDYHLCSYFSYFFSYTPLFNAYLYFNKNFYFHHEIVKINVSANTTV